MHTRSISAINISAKNKPMIVNISDKEKEADF